MMAAQGRAVDMPITMTVERQVGTWMTTRWRYLAARDPLSVHVDFGGGNVWTLSRELLVSGLSRPSGLGDIAMWPHKGRFFLALTSPDGRAVLSARHGHVDEFLAITCAWVPVGEELAYLDLDATVERLLGGGR